VVSTPTRLDKACICRVVSPAIASVAMDATCAVVSAATCVAVKDRISPEVNAEMSVVEET
jgi:hypothetical protein